MHGPGLTRGLPAAKVTHRMNKRTICILPSARTDVVKNNVFKKNKSIDYRVWPFHQGCAWLLIREAADATGRRANYPIRQFPGAPGLVIGTGCVRVPLWYYLDSFNPIDW